MSTLKIFDETSIRAKWNDDEDQWWFVVQDVIQYLTDSVKPRDYWYRLKQRVEQSDGFQLSTNCRQLKFEAGRIIKNTVHEIESKTSRKIISESNSKKLNTSEINTSIVRAEFHDKNLEEGAVQ